MLHLLWPVHHTQRPEVAVGHREEHHEYRWVPVALEPHGYVGARLDVTHEE